MPASQWVAGVDGCRGGWVVVVRHLESGEVLPPRVMSSFVEVLALLEAPVVIAVDVPIGLPDEGVPGGREVDGLVRKRLVARRSSVFSAPGRSALDAWRLTGRREADYTLVARANQGSSGDGPKISRQAFGIFEKIDEVDVLLASDPALQDRVREVHPELSFTEAKGSPMLHAKKRAAGARERDALLDTLGFPRAPAVRGAANDDVRDAGIACWTAVRIATGTARGWPEHPARDRVGLRMEMWS